jgi:TonB family protein
MRTYKSWHLVAMAVAAFVPFSAAALHPAGFGTSHTSAHDERPWKAIESNSKFLHIPRADASCESTTAPEPLTTPTPVIDGEPADSELSVSFIIGTDGLVHSALLLKSIGNAEDRTVLNVVRSWRYRPALCNGVPTETEATVDFSSRRRSFGLE